VIFAYLATDSECRDHLPNYMLFFWKIFSVQ